MPPAAVEICRQRFTPGHFQRAVNLAEVYTPDTGIGAGFLDAIAPAGDLLQVATDNAAALSALDPEAHTTTKLRSRAPPWRSCAPRWHPPKNDGDSSGAAGR